jgi:hypothetical protein
VLYRHGVALIVGLRFMNASPRVLARTVGVVAAGAVVVGCSAATRMDGVLPQWANPQPQVLDMPQNETKRSKYRAEAQRRSAPEVPNTQVSKADRVNRELSPASAEQE